MNRAEWLERRRKGIGGTDAAAILGLSRFRSPRDIWLDKLGLAPERPVTAPMLWGLRLEDAIATAYSETTDVRLYRPPAIRRAKHVRDFPMIGSIDRIAQDGSRFVELKTSRSDTGFAPADGWRDFPPEKRIPPDYYVQVQHYGEVLEADRADVAALFSGSDFRIYEIPIDREFGADLRSEESKFWRDNVLARVEPPASALDLGTMNARYSVADPNAEKPATAEIALAVEDALSAREEIERLELLRDGADAKIRDYLGPAYRLIVGGASVTWSRFERKSVAWKDLAASYRRGLDLLAARLIEPATTDELTASLDRDELAELQTLLSNLDTIEALYTKTAPSGQFRIAREGIE